MRGTTLLLAVPGLPQQFKPIPREYWRRHGRPAVKAKVECPCGHRPVIRYGQLKACRRDAASPHRCQRVFVFTGRSVLVSRAAA